MTYNFLHENLSSSIDKALFTLSNNQRKEGFWHYNLESDCTMSADYIFMMHYIGVIDEDIQKRIAKYILKNQQLDGGWCLYFGGNFDISCSVKAYYALKLAGEETESDAMVKARNIILANGGASGVNVFTLFMLFFLIKYQNQQFLLHR